MVETPEININVEVPEKAKRASKKVVENVEAVSSTPEEVEIATNETFNMMYGAKWYFFTKGERTTVPAEVKEYLKKQNALAVL